MLEFNIKAVVQDVQGENQYTLYLFNSRENILIPINLSRDSCKKILCVMNRFPADYAIPTFFSTFITFLNLTQSKIIKGLVYKSLEKRFYTYICIRYRNEEYRINTLFSDCLGLCILTEKPLYVMPEVYNKEGIKVTKKLLSDSLSISI